MKKLLIITVVVFICLKFANNICIAQENEVLWECTLENARYTPEEEVELPEQQILYIDPAHLNWPMIDWLNAWFNWKNQPNDVIKKNPWAVYHSNFNVGFILEPNMKELNREERVNLIFDLAMYMATKIEKGQSFLKGNIPFNKGDVDTYGFMAIAFYYWQLLRESSQEGAETRWEEAQNLYPQFLEDHGCRLIPSKDRGFFGDHGNPELLKIIFGLPPVDINIGTLWEPMSDRQKKEIRNRLERQEYEKNMKYFEAMAEEYFYLIDHWQEIYQ